MMRAILPALEADSALYRSYVYTEEAPLSCAIRSYGGESDPNVRPEHLEAWREQSEGIGRSETLRKGLDHAVEHAAHVGVEL